MFLLLKAVGDQSMGGVIGGYADLYPIALYYLDPVFFHAAGKDAGNYNIIIALNFHGASAHDPGYNTLQLD
jgi:hypothetical protein